MTEAFLLISPAAAACTTHTTIVSATARIGRCKRPDSASQRSGLLGPRSRPAFQTLFVLRPTRKAGGV